MYKYIHNQTFILNKDIKGAGIICMNKKNYNCLLVYNKNKYGFPKGHLLKNESYINGAFREFREETGITKRFKISGYIIVKNVIYFIIFSYEFKLCYENIITKNEISAIYWENIFDIPSEKTTIAIKTFINYSKYLFKIDRFINMDKIIAYRTNYYNLAYYNIHVIKFYKYIIKYIYKYNLDIDYYKEYLNYNIKIMIIYYKYKYKNRYRTKLTIN
jgi:hypothetical protein